MIKLVESHLLGTQREADDEFMRTNNPREKAGAKENNGRVYYWQTGQRKREYFVPSNLTKKMRQKKEKKKGKGKRGRKKLA